MTFARAVAVLAATLFAAPVPGEIPASMKARRLAPPEPPPAAVAVPEEAAPPLLGSCRAADGACAAWEGAFAGMDPKALCEKAKGTWSTDACPVEGSVGACTQRQPGSQDRIVTRSYPPTKAEAARKACVGKPRGIFLKAR
jgi:hypothetical protein